MMENTCPTNENPIMIPEDIYLKICYELDVKEITLMGIA